MRLQLIVADFFSLNLIRFIIRFDLQFRCRFYFVRINITVRLNDNIFEKRVLVYILFCHYFMFFLIDCGINDDILNNTVSLGSVF